MDENTVVSALNLEDAQGNEDFTCAHLWLNILENCHHIVVNDYLLKGYYRKTASARNSGQAVRIIHHVMTNAVKSEFIGYSPSYSWASQLPPDDAPIVLLAHQSGAVLVTSDSRLRGKVESLSSLASLRILAPREAVPLSQGT